jgi:nucleoside-diphosphate-sugar epimerase
VARILIVGGGCRGRRLATRLVGQGHALRVTTRSDDGRAAIEATGAECWIGTPDRLATLRGALDNVTVACWMLAGASGDREQVAALHASRLQFFLSQAIDTTVRGLIYDAWSPRADRVSAEELASGQRIFESLTRLNAIPAVVLVAGAAPTAGDGPRGEAADDDGAGEDERWVAAASRAVDSLLGLSAG